MKNSMNTGIVICEEHGTCLGDSDLIHAICYGHKMTRKEFDALPADEQEAMQRSWVGAMPCFS